MRGGEANDLRKSRGRRRSFENFATLLQNSIRFGKFSRVRIRVPSGRERDHHSGAGRQCCARRGSGNVVRQRTGRERSELFVSNQHRKFVRDDDREQFLHRPECSRTVGSGATGSDLGSADASGLDTVFCELVFGILPSSAFARRKTIIEHERFFVQRDHSVVL